MTNLRHGETLGNACHHKDIPPKITEMGDDELTPHGEAQARALGASKQFAVLAASMDAVLVSPLRRALKTALLVFSGQEVFKERTLRGKGSVVLILDPNLRELNRYQKSDGKTPLYWRHCGTVISELRMQFIKWCANIDPAVCKRVEVDWGSGGNVMRNDRVWWDSESLGRKSPCTVNYWDAHWRAHSCNHAIRERAVRNKWSHVCLVAHEGVFRCMTGVAAVPNCGSLVCAVGPPIFPMLSTLCRRSKPPHHTRHATAPYLKITKAIPVETIREMKVMPFFVTFLNILIFVPGLV